MKIQIRTIRTIRNEDYIQWISALKCNGIKIDDEKLRRNKKISFHNSDEYTSATTTYEILEE